MTFTDLQAEHGGLLDLFVEFQCALMELDLKAAHGLLGCVVAQLGVHSEVEERVLMPIYVQHAAGIEGGSPELFRAEHAKLERLLGDLGSELDGMLSVPGPPSPVEALALIERGFTFKHLWDHHTKREDAVFYPLLKRAVEPGAVDGLRAAMESARRAAAARLEKA